jgi:hypothetical protein
LQQVLDSKFKLKLEASFYGLDLSSYPTLDTAYNTVIHLNLHRAQAKYLRWYPKLGCLIRVTHHRNTFNLENVNLIKLMPIMVNLIMNALQCIWWHGIFLGTITPGVLHEAAWPRAPAPRGDAQSTTSVRHRLSGEAPDQKDASTSWRRLRQTQGHEESNRYPFYGLTFLAHCRGGAHDWQRANSEFDRQHSMVRFVGYA